MRTRGHGKGEQGNQESVADRLAHGRACDRVGRVKFLGGEWLES